jgi:hypothetical protein
MTSSELEKLIKDRLSDAGLAAFLDERTEQYLEFPDGFFAEVVLKDGSKLAEAHRVVKSVKEDLGKLGIDLHVIIRAIWEVVAVESAGIISGGFHRFRVTLQSGGRECTVDVNVTGLAFAEILSAFRGSNLRDYGSDQNTVLAGIVTKFVRLELSYGGESSWDPLLRPELELNEWALQYLTSPSPVKAG